MTAGQVSPGQEQLWILEALDSGDAYNLSVCWWLDGPLDVKALACAVIDIQQRHETLRWRLRLDGGVVRYEAGEPVDLQVNDLEPEGGTEAERERIAVCRARQETQARFDLATSAPARFSLLRTGSGRSLFTCVIHHAVADGWSLTILSRDMSALYHAHHVGAPAQLEPLRPYAEYVRETRRLEIERPTMRAYWQERLRSAPQVLDFPYDTPPVTGIPSRANRLTRTWTRQIAEGVGTAAKRLRTTPFTMMLLSYATTLARYTGQDEIVVGVPLGNRDDPAFRSTIGLFVNTIPVRIAVQHRRAFAENIAELQAHLLADLRHAQLPFTEIAHAAGSPTGARLSPLFQAMLAYQNVAASPLMLDGVTSTVIDLPPTTPMYDLRLLVTPRPDSMQLTLEHAAPAILPASGGRLLDSLAALVSEAVKDPSRPVGRLPRLPSEDLRCALERSMGPSMKGPFKPVHVLFGEQVERSPDAVAVVCGDESVTYEALNRRAEAVAVALRRLGVGPGARVGVCLQRSVAMVAAVLGVLRSGGAYVPLDPEYPRQRLAMMAEDAGLSVVLADRVGAGVLVGVQVLLVPDAVGEVPVGDGDGAGGALGGVVGDLAYVMYTSGSTGRPKGVLISHRALSSFVPAILERIPVTSHDSFLAITSLSFDISILELLVPLTVGATVVVAREEQLTAHAMSEAIARHSITLVQATPSFWRNLLRSGWAPTRGVRILSGGEALTPEVARGLAHASDGLFNLYGPTEATIWASIHQVAGSDPEARSVVPIGRPIANVRVDVLDQWMEPVPVGVVGELYIGGVALARGYWRRPSLTAERFVPNPFGPPGSRLYRTGDRARWLADGTIEFLGRVDNQVKLRGFRIELGEVEATLRGHPEVGDAAVVAASDGQEESRLVAYVVGRAGGSVPSGDRLRGFVAERLPHYMVPAVYVPLERMPLTPNGKLDRRALPDPGMGRVAAGEYVAPAGWMEEELAGLWESVLGVARVGATDNFFDLGGDSLKALRLVVHIENRFTRRLDLRAIADHPSLRELAAAITRASSRAGSTAQRGSRLVSLGTASERPALFLIHPLGGHVLCYQEISRLLADSMDVYGIQARVNDGEQSPLRSIQEMAALYLEDLEGVFRTRPRGPIVVGGWCMGGIVALELAHQLMATSRGRPNLIVPISVDVHQPVAAGILSDWGTLLHLSFRLLGWTDLVPESDRVISLLPAGADLDVVVSTLSREELLPPGSDPMRLRAALDTYRSHTQALLAYRPRRYDGDIALFLPEAGVGPSSSEVEGTDTVADPYAGWDSVADGRLVRDFVPGDHYSMMRSPNVGHLALRIVNRVQQLTHLTDRTAARP